MVHAGCNLTITVGFLLGDATKAQATANPDSHFAIIDYSYRTPVNNVKPIIYDTAQAAFLAGYLAAGTTKTGRSPPSAASRSPPSPSSWTASPTA